MRRIGKSAVCLLGCIALAGCVLQRLEQDLSKLDDIAHLFTGDVTTEVLEFHSTLVIAMDDRDAERVTSFRMMSGPGTFEIRAARSPHFFFAFADLNKDLRFQSHEPYGWAGHAAAIEPAGEATRSIDIVISEQPPLPYPEKLVDLPLEQHLNNYVRTHIGTVSSLDDPLFSNRQGRKGLWEPFAFMEDGGTGIHFLEPYDPARDPVLFIHGINGAPTDFSELIDQLDRRRFQPWVVSYPSGLRLTWLSRAIFQFLEVLHLQYGFERIHIIAHSMGGLVSRGTLNLCSENQRCGYVRSYTTLSSPWGGIAWAGAGVRHSPAVVPVWNDLAPDGEFLQTLFDKPLPDTLPHYLLFGFRQDSFLSTSSSDGVIPLSSQLRYDAQQQATSVRGFDESHSSILDSAAVVDRLNTILRETAQ